MIKVLITEDSPVVRGYLRFVLESDPDIEVVGVAEDGVQAIEMAHEQKPDVITMDIHMPRMDGFEATRRIMETSPVPIVICSASWNPEEVEKTFKSMEAGAVAALEKPRGMGYPDSENSAAELLKTVKLMSGVKVVRRWSKDRVRKKPVKEDTVSPETMIRKEIKLVAVGASTGGPLILQTLLKGLPKDFPVPVIIVQHIAQGFLQGLGDWLSRTTGFPVHIVENHEKMEGGKAYLAPDGFQLGIDSHLRAIVSKNKEQYSLCPSVSHFFDSAAKTFRHRLVGVLLTGMGKDGAEELKKLRDIGAPTIAQDKKTSIVHGMPGEAIKIDGASYVLASNQIAPKLVNLICKPITAISS